MPLVTIRDHTFFNGNLGPGSVVLDLGANVGDFARQMVTRFGCRCYCVEAAPDTFKKISSDARVTKANYAVSGKSGTANLHIDSNPESSSLQASGSNDCRPVVTVPAKTLGEVFAEFGLGQVDLIKMDIEGAEIGVLDATPDKLLNRVRQFTIEFHDFNGMTAVSDVRRVLKRFRDLGWLVYTRSLRSYLDTLIINPHLCSCSPRELWWPRISGYFAGAIRVMRTIGRQTKNIK
jgi:FkbM family methyltransferase